MRSADKQKFTVYLPPEDNWRNKPQSAPPKTPKARTPKVRPSRKTGGGGGHKTTHTPPPAEKLDKEQLEVRQAESQLADTLRAADEAQGQLQRAQEELERLLMSYIHRTYFDNNY